MAPGRPDRPQTLPQLQDALASNGAAVVRLVRDAAGAYCLGCGMDFGPHNNTMWHWHTSVGLHRGGTCGGRIFYYGHAEAPSARRMRHGRFC